MSEEVPETAGAATRNLLGAVGFIMLLLGGEMLIDKTGGRFKLAIILIAGGVPIFFAGVCWKWLQNKLARGFSKKLNLLSNDPRWWLAILLFYIIGSYAQLSYSSSHWDVGAVSGDWVWIGLIVLAILYVVMTWRRIGIITAPVTSSSQQTTNVSQNHLDMIHLLDFAINDTTYRMLQRLIEIADSPAVTDSFKAGLDTDDAHKSREWFVGYVRQELGAGTIRHSEYQSVMYAAQSEAEHELEATPQDQRPSGIDPLTVRRHMISERQFKRAILFLQNQRRDVEERLVQQRHRLIERLQQRQEKTFG
jgi:hypothetical protein